MSARRLLIVSPHYVPVNAPDMHRVRLMLPYIAQYRWECTVLAVCPDLIEGANFDERLSETIPKEVSVHYSRGIPYRWTRPWGIGSLWLRCGTAFRNMAANLLQSETFDLAFISTSQFDAFSLGPEWLREHNLPYVLDFQDPWINDYHNTHSGQPPGGRLKYYLAQRKARHREPEAVRHAGGLVCVSPRYVPSLLSRYPDIGDTPMRILPFAASSIDLDLARRSRPLQPLVPTGDGCIHHVYTGRCTPNMRPALDILFGAFRRFLDRDPVAAIRHRFHFVGTDYAPAGLAQYNVLPAAEAAGVMAYVSEHPMRVPYFEALHYLTMADSILVLGSDDTGYNPSKLNPCLLTGRPVLVIAHQRSPIFAKALDISLPMCCGFESSEPGHLADLAVNLCDNYFERHGHAQIPPPSVASGIPDAAGMTHELVGLFDEVLQRRKSRCAPVQ